MVYYYSLVLCFRYIILCVCYITFFFFKPKTAYEMRISDWSSDVCSSALAQPHHVTVIALDQRHAPKLRGTGITALDAQGEIAGCRFQIGRASCRERVCQYV